MSERPFISVVVPTCHRNDLLAKCLDTLAPGKQKLAAFDYEVIVTDDGRACTAEGMIAQDYPWALWKAGPKDGPAANRNSGARHARGEWIAFVDDDCLPDPGWLEAIATVARDERVDVIEGRTVIPDKVDSPFQEGIENLGGGNYWSCNLTVRRKVFEELRGFDEDFKEAADEDLEFAWRFRQRGCCCAFITDALVFHPVREMSWSAIWRKTKRLRWSHLRALKTLRTSWKAGPAPAVLAQAGTIYLLNVARTTWHLISRFDPRWWRTPLFWQIWRWLTLPYMLPYIAMWELRYRRLLLARKKAAQ